MITRSIRTLTMVSAVGALAFGAVSALEVPAVAQTITVKCWREYCVTDPETHRESCVREEIPCPTEQT
jgi:hypothetical protein